MNRLKIRCLGGFEVWHGDDQITSFESQKTKALLAFLLSHRRRALTRDRLAALLWPETGDEAARRNLRQAIYSLKRDLPSEGAAPFLADDGQLRLNPEYEWWYDVEAFEQELARAHSGGSPDPHRLATAVDLYGGDFLAGFHIKDSEEFDLWMVSEQERLRDKVLEALRILVESYLSRGEYRFGVQYARRLVAIDPLAEEAYRYLMRLYALSGRRSQALARYEDLRQVLRDNMDVEPMPETEALHKAILREGVPAVAPVHGDGEPIGPLIPLVGRDDAFERLERCWRAVLGGESRLTLVTGEAGVGKSRLVKSFLGSAHAQGELLVLQGRCFADGPKLHQPFPQVLRNALAADSPAAERALRHAPVELLAELAPMVPGLCHLRPDVSSRLPAAETNDVYAFAPPQRTVGPRRLHDAAARLLERIARGAPEALVIFLDDLHLAGPETFDLLRHLVERLAGLGVWIVATRRSDVARPEALARFEEDGCAERIELERLAPEAVEAIAASLLRGEETAELGRFLIRWGEGLPLAVAEAINFLWDEGVLVPDKTSRWRLTRPPDEVNMPASGSFVDLIVRRFYRLPSSTRRLAALAAVMGRRFDVELLRQAADELAAVVEVNLELLLERWLVRHCADAWIPGGRESCMVQWARGARRGSFEFAHELGWRAIYEELDPRRRKIMHGEVASALEGLYASATAAGDLLDAEGLCETLARHFAAAGVWDQAFFYLRQAARKARHLGARDAALSYCSRSLEALEHLIASTRDAQQSDAWRQERRRLLRVRGELAAASPSRSSSSARVA